jgi:hypothetical protein
MLIVEGDPFMAQDLQRQFTHLGHTVLACASPAQEAIAHVQMYRPAVVLMNLHPVLGRTKPGWLGRSGRECWHDIWDLVGPMIDSVFETGEANWCEELVFSMDRNLPREEAYFTFSHSPIYVHPGRVGGVFAACSGTTERMVGERRLRTLNALAACASEARTAEEACHLARQRLAIGDSAVAFTLVYLLSAAGNQAHLVAGPTGLDPREAAEVITLANAADYLRRLSIHLFKTDSPPMYGSPSSSRSKRSRWS